MKRRLIFTILPILMFLITLNCSTSQTSFGNTTDAPSKRSGFVLCYDKVRKVVVLFGGQDDSDKKMNDTWEWANGKWTKIDVVGPIPRINSCMVYNDSTKKTYLWGGFSDSGVKNDLWEYNGKAWNQIPVQNSPKDRQLGTMIYDKFNDRILLFGGMDSLRIKLSDTWEYSNKEWKQLHTKTTPPPRSSHAMTFIEDKELVVIYGGYGDSSLTDMWGFVENDWILLSEKSPAPSLHSSMAYNTNDKRIILFGGFDENGRTNDLWEYSDSRWTKLILPQKKIPEKRAEHEVVYIPDIGIFLFGGVIGQNPDTRNRGNDTWILSSKWMKQ